MTFPSAYAENEELDAQLVYAAMHGMFPLSAMHLGLTPDEAYGRAEWLKLKARRAYRMAVIRRVVDLDTRA